ncbi:MAG: CHAT domain-containing protein [Bacteroidetes bacterium]|nr:CHAT domain-containing protein [Bacteroidota bacterium]MBU1680837.1 CHAT domain-containing protein [Bacteroidota bacterium]
MNLSNSDLLVMSACETGLAQIKKNDDMIGLVRGFLYAGIPSVIASLWKVNDLATYKLMTDFYQFLSQNKGKAESLRLAQKEMISTAAFNHPFFWSAFNLNGFGE